MSVASPETASQIKSAVELKGVAGAATEEVLSFTELTSGQLFSCRPGPGSTEDGAVREQLAHGEESFLGFCVRSFQELTLIKFALMSFVVNGLRRRYQRSVLGFAWSLLNPILMMAILTVVFSILFKSDPRKFAIHIFTGLVPWTFISESIAGGCTSIVGNESFLKKVYIPKLFFPMVTVGTETINFALSLTALLFLGLFIGMQVGWTFLLIPVAIAITFAFSFGLCLATAVSTVYFRDLTHLVRVILSSLFYLLPIMYPLERVPAAYQPYFLLNPFAHFLGLYRSLIYSRTLPETSEWLICLALTAVSLLIGLTILYKREKDLIFRL